MPIFYLITFEGVLVNLNGGFHVSLQTQSSLLSWTLVLALFYLSGEVCKMSVSVLKLVKCEELPEQTQLVSTDSLISVLISGQTDMLEITAAPSFS